MRNDQIRETGSRVERTANGAWQAIWRGQAVYDRHGHMKQFPGEAAAWEYIDECDKAGRTLD